MRSGGDEGEKEGGSANRELCDVWSPGGTGASFSYTMNRAMEVRLAVTDARGTVARDSMVVSFGSGGGGGNLAQESAGAMMVDAQAPQAFEVGVPYPNPARERASVRYGVPAAATVRVTVYDLLGRAVQVRDHGTVGAGWHEASLDVSSWRSGVYVVRVEAGSEVRTLRLIVR